MSDDRTDNQIRLDNLLTLRVLATLAVVFGHAASFFNAFSWSQYPQAPYIQSQAVTVFFLVSGYTIAWVCDRDAARGGGIAGFMLARIVRLLVPLAPILLLMALAEYWLYDTPPYPENFNPRTFVANLLFLQNISLGIPGLSPVADAFSTNRPLWTISIEFWIYAAFAGSFFAFTSENFKSAFYSIALAVLGWALLDDDIIGGRGSGLTAIWLIGALTYWGLKRSPLPRRQDYLIAAPLAVFVLYLLASPRNWPATGTYSHGYNLLIAAAFFSIHCSLPKIPVGMESLNGMVWGILVHNISRTLSHPIFFMEERAAPQE